MEPVTIQPVELSNLDAAALLFDAQLREHQVQPTSNGLRDVVRAVVVNPHRGFILLASLNGAPVGVAYAAALLSLEHEGVIGWLEELYVRPENRNAGIGSGLLREVISRACGLGWEGIELELIAGHERAASIYLRHNFRRLSRHRFCRLFSRGN